MESLKAIKYQRGKLEVLDQLRLPHEFCYCDVSTCEDAFDAIKTMRVRGAPAIAIVAALALAVELVQKRDDATTKEDLITYINSRLDFLVGSRPTAVDLYNATRLLKDKCLNASFNNTSLDACADIRINYIISAEKILEDDLSTNLAIGRYGAEYLKCQQLPVSTPIGEADQIRYFRTSPPGTQLSNKVYPKLSVLTHCNTGSLATSGHGTALGIIRSLHKMNYLYHTYYTETRPYNQGSRLTAFELNHESIPSTLITDSMVGALFARKKEEQNIAAVVVGADRVARNGDTANKIGTYSLAVLARHHGIKFLVAAPTTSIDLRTETGDTILIEDRSGTELIQTSGPLVNSNGQVDATRTVRIATADQRAGVWNPSFDVTPAALIDAIITERGEVIRNSMDGFNFKDIMPDKWNREVTCEELDKETT